MYPNSFRGTVLFLALAIAPAVTLSAQMERVRVSDDKRAFALDPSGRPWVPWGFNYDHDEKGRLLEDYWLDEWRKVEEDFDEMRQMGANVVRVHLQFGKFMESADRSNAANLRQLSRLLCLAERLRLYVDVTGLGCYHKQDVPVWYDALSEQERWKAQARFWQAVAGRCAASPAVFCYDLMNEPVVPAGVRNPGDWLGPALAGKHFVQCITLQQAGRPRPAIARQWIRRLVAAIRSQDRQGLVTVGLVPWSLDRPGLTSGFVPGQVAGDLDFLSVHLYPETGRIEDSLNTLAGFSVAKPVVVEEMFPLRCSAADLERFVDQSRPIASGWLGFYWGKTPAECRRSSQLADAWMLDWLESFRRRATQK